MDEAEKLKERLVGHYALECFPEGELSIRDERLFLYTGSKKDIHDAIRGKGGFDRVITAVINLQKAGLGKRLNLSTTVMRQNIHDLKDIVSLTERLAVPLVRFLPLRRAGYSLRIAEAAAIRRYTG